MKNITLTEKEILQEEILIEDAKLDSKRFKPLYEKYYIIIFRFIYNKVDDKETAADLTSHVFLNALLHISKYQHKKLPFSAWLYKIASNEIMQYYRKAKKERIIFITEELVSNLAEDQETLNPEILKTKLEAAMQHLEYQEMEILQLRFYENLSFKEIGHIFNITENYAKVKTYRLLEKIKKSMANTY